MEEQYAEGRGSLQDVGAQLMLDNSTSLNIQHPKIVKEHSRSRDHSRHSRSSAQARLKNATSYDHLGNSYEKYAKINGRDVSPPVRLGRTNDSRPRTMLHDTEEAKKRAITNVQDALQQRYEDFKFE